jgi:hypothetical protein
MGSHGVEPGSESANRDRSRNQSDRNEARQPDSVIRGKDKIHPTDISAVLRKRRSIRRPTGQDGAYPGPATCRFLGPASSQFRFRQSWDNSISTHHSSRYACPCTAVCIGVHIETGPRSLNIDQFGNGGVDRGFFGHAVSQRRDDAQHPSDWGLFTSNPEHGPGAQTRRLGVILQMRLCDRSAMRCQVSHGLPFRRGTCMYHRAEACISDPCAQENKEMRPRGGASNRVSVGLPRREALPGRVRN